MGNLFSRERTIYFDYLRILATFAVMVLHVSSSGLYIIDVHKSQWQAINFYESMVRWGVPVFVMISGALFLGRRLTLSDLYSKYIFRLVVAFVFWSFVYFLFSTHTPCEQLISLFSHGKTLNFAVIIKGHYHLWFLPMIVGVYMSLPVTCKIAQDKNVLQYFLILSFIFWFLIPQITLMLTYLHHGGLQNILQALNHVVSEMHMHLFLGYVFYFLLGYYLANKEFERKTRIGIYVLGFMGFLFTWLASAFISLHSNKPILTFYANYRVNTLLIAMALFVFFKSCSLNFGLVKSFITKMSNYSFGAYLVHALIITKLRVLGLTIQLFHPIFSVLFISVVVFCCSFAISALLHRIPWVNKYLV